MVKKGAKIKPKQKKKSRMWEGKDKRRRFKGSSRSKGRKCFHVEVEIPRRASLLGARQENKRRGKKAFANNQGDWTDPSIVSETTTKEISMWKESQVG